MRSKDRSHDFPDHGFTFSRLPDPSIEEDWQRIIVEAEVKQRLLRYLDVLTDLGDQQASVVGLALRRALLFYGEPGNGKTSLSRGLPNYWAILRNRSPLLVHVNAHALPSGERGGSQKNIQNLFKGLCELTSSGETTFLLADEIESIGTDRASVNPETNPLDTLYAVNAFIECLDELVKKRPNVICLFTTNIPRAIDRAITERMDFAIHIPLPNEDCRRLILADAFCELDGQGDALQTDLASVEGVQLIELTEGFSARQLRHLIIQALTFTPNPTELSLVHLIQAAETQIEEQNHNIQNGGVYLHEYQRKSQSNN